jgi:hypothetical protein
MSHGYRWSVGHGATIAAMPQRLQPNIGEDTPGRPPTGVPVAASLERAWGFSQPGW